MSDRALTVLLVSDNAVDIDQVQMALAESKGSKLHVERVARLDEGIDRLTRAGIDVVLLDLFLPDSQGLETFKTLFEAAPLMPILLLVSRENEKIAYEAAQLGAQDHILRDHLDAYSLPRILRGVIERKASEDALFAERERAQVTLDSIGDAVLSIDIAGNVAYLNAVAEEMTGWSRREAVGRPLADVFRIVDAVTRMPALDPLAEAVRQGRSVGLSPNSILIRRDGLETSIEDSAAPIHDRGGQVSGAVIVFHDVSTAKSVTQRMAHLAQHDFLTSLPNRLLFGDRVSNAVALAQRHGKKCAVLFIDLDGFKHVNDSLGHPIGDEILQSVSRRLVFCVRGSDTVSRQGGDEFAVLFSEIEHTADAALGAQKLLWVLAAPHRVAGKELLVSASIGVSIYPDDGEDAQTLIGCADTAMYHAKHLGRNNFRLFTEDKAAAALEEDPAFGGAHDAAQTAGGSDDHRAPGLRTRGGKLRVNDSRAR